MKKTSLMQLLWNLLAAAICFALSYLLIGIITLIFEWAIGVTPIDLDSPIWTTVVFAIPTIILYALGGWGFYGLSDYFNRDKDKPNEWSARIKANDPLDRREAQKQCLPYIIIALALVILRIVFWNALNDAIKTFLEEQFADNSELAFGFNFAIIGILACYMAVALTSTIELPVAILLHSCPNCDNLCGFVYESDAADEVVVTTKWKEEVDTGYKSDFHEYVTKTPKVNCRCCFCGATKVFTDRHRSSTREQKY